MSIHDNRFPPSPWKPVVGSLTTIVTIQAIAILAAVAVLALRDGTCYP